MRSSDINKEEEQQDGQVPRFYVSASRRDDDYAFEIIQANREAKRFLKLGKDHLFPFTFPETLHDWRLVNLKQAMRDVCGSMKSVLFSLPISDNGEREPFDLVILPSKVSGGEVRELEFLGVSSDAQESSLQRERDDAMSLLTSVFDVSEVGIIVTDRHQRIVRVNQSFVRIYGWKREELIGKEFPLLMPEEEREQARLSHQEFLKGGIRSSGEMRLQRKDGNVANALFTTAALQLSHGRRFQVMTIMDITLRKQMEVSLRLAKEQADAANRAKSTFLANMSHELRTPMNAIIGFSEMILKETFGELPNAKYKEYLSDIHSSAVHLLDIINEVLDMSKIEAGRVELDEEYFDFKNVVISANRMMDSRAFSSGVKISEDVSEQLPPVYGDSKLIRQILINLVGNAVKYSRQGGQIKVTAHQDEGNRLIIQISDQGVGIPPDRLEEALEPFGQVSSRGKNTNEVQGTGLGLPLAKSMAELHGGELMLESEINQGTTVTVILPAWRLEKYGLEKENQGPSFKFKPAKTAEKL